jgi:ribosome recycling factor
MDQAVEKVSEDFRRSGPAVPTRRSSTRCWSTTTAAPTPLQQLANFSVPEPRILIVNPFDKGSVMPDREGDPGVRPRAQPANDGGVIRCVFPELTEERRREYIKLAKSAAEDGKVASATSDAAPATRCRSSRTTVRSADEHERYAKQLEELTGKHVAQIDKALEQKEQELLEV